MIASNHHKIIPISVRIALSVGPITLMKLGDQILPGHF